MSDWVVHNADCLDFLRTLPDGSVDAVVTDPPYGINLDTDYNSKNKNSSVHRRVHDDDCDFDPSPWLSFPKVVLWGANNYASRLPNRGGWLVWDKVTRNGLKVRIAEYELAWCNCVTRTQGLRHMWSGAFRDSERGTKFHPCQKPVALAQWVMDVCGIEEGATVLDPYCGSGSIGVACAMTGRNYIGIEIDAGYCEIARRRIAEAVPLFAESKA